MLPNGEKIQVKDGFSYFVTSEDAADILIEKLHLCSWRYRKYPFFKHKRLLEVGMQIKFITTDKPKWNKVEDRQLVISILIPWVDAQTKHQDLYRSLKDTKNARFIFNEDVTSAEYFDGGDGETGAVLAFDRRICVLPCSYSCSAGVVECNITIPKDVDLNVLPIYIRGVFSVPVDKYSYSNNGFSKSLYAYDVKVNESRSLPTNVKKHNVCKIDTCYCLHIVPSYYQLSFYDANNFRSVRMLEYMRYNDYVKGLRLFETEVKENEYQVVFNKVKSPDDQKFTFFSMFESEHIGVTPLTIAVVIDIVISIVFMLIQK